MAEELKYAVSLEDHVSAGAKSAGAALHGLEGGLKTGKDAFSKFSQELLRTVEPAEVARHAVEGVEAGIRGMSTALKSGDIPGLVEGASEAFAGLATTLDLVVPGLGQVAGAAIKMGGRSSERSSRLPRRA